MKVRGFCLTILGAIALSLPNVAVRAGLPHAAPETVGMNPGHLQKIDSAFGHGGFTGTTMWMDPQLDLFVIFLSNRVHPNGKGSVNPLAGRIGTIAAASIDSPGGSRPTASGASGTSREAAALASPRDVFSGIDVLEKEKFRRLRGQRVGLITNQTGINRAGVSTLRLLHEAEEVELVALFSPEHGLAGKLDQRLIGDAREQTTGLTVFSLYGESRRPSKESLQGIDVLVFDIQDIGTRFYTYISTMGHSMQATAEHNLRFMVLDRPNPINGVDVSGPMLDAGRESFVAFHSLPVRHGMTVGELARMFNDELQLDLQLDVVPVSGWKRTDYFDTAGQLWVNPSPNMRSLAEAVLYPGIGLLETTNLSVGRGTDTPFEVIGAPWLDGQKLAARLRASNLPGVVFVPIRFTPDASKFNGELCGGVNISVIDRARFRSLATGLEIARQIRLLHPDDWKVESYDRLLGNEETLQAIIAGKTVAEIEAAGRDELRAFLKRRSRYLLYE